MKIFPRGLMFAVLFSGCLFPGFSAVASIISADPADVGFDGQILEATSTYNVVACVPIVADGQGATLSGLTINNPDWWDDYPAAEPLDIAANSVRLWYVAADTGTLNTTTAQFVGSLTTVGRGGITWEITGLTQWTGNGGALYITIDITASPSPDVGCRFQFMTSDISFTGGQYFPATDMPIQPPRILVSSYNPPSQLNVGHTGSTQIILSTGQNFTPLTLNLANPDPDWPLTPVAPIFLTGLTLTVRDAAGNTLAPNTACDQLGVRDLDSASLPSLVAAPASSSGTIFIPLAVTVTALDIQHRLEVFGTVCSNTFTAAANFRLEITAGAAVQAQDAFTFRVVPVLASNDNFPMQSNLFTVQYAATRALVYHTPTLAQNTAIIKGQTNIVPLALTFSNSGNTGSAQLDIKRLTFSVSDAAGATLAPAAVFSRIAVSGSVFHGETTALPATGGLITLTLTNSFISVPVYQPVTVSVVVDILPDAAATAFRLSLPNAASVLAQDSNSLFPVNAANAFASDPFPMSSHVILLASSFRVAGSSLAPKTLYPNQRRALLDLTFSHPGPTDVGVLLLQGLTVTARDGGGTAQNLADAVSDLYILDAGGSPLAQISGPFAGSSVFVPLPNVSVAPYAAATLRLEARIQDSPQAKTLALGLINGDAVAVLQPSDPTRKVYVAGTWPVFSRSAAVGGGEGRLRLSNYPNPFAAGRSRTQIAFYLESPATVTATLFTLAGDQVAALMRGELLGAGETLLAWDGRTESGAVVTNGVYLLRLEAVLTGSDEKIVQLRKIAVVK